MKGPRDPLEDKCLIFVAALVMLFSVFVAGLFEAGVAELSGKAWPTDAWRFTDVTGYEST